MPPFLFTTTSFGLPSVSSTKSNEPIIGNGRLLFLDMPAILTARDAANLEATCRFAQDSSCDCT